MTQTSTERQPASPAIQRLSLISAILASTIATIDASAVNVALPAISRNLGGGLATQQWISNAYLLSLGALILLAGSLTDRIGERRIFLLGVAGFGAASVLCALAPNTAMLIAARAIQGATSAMLTPASLAVIVAVFPRDLRGAAIGRWTAWGGIGILIGPLIGGQIVDVASWRWIFLLNVPIVLVTLALAMRTLPKRSMRRLQDSPLDYGGAALAAISLTCISFALIEQPVLGWAHLGIWVPLVVGTGLFGAFIAYEARVKSPMLPLKMFRQRNFSVTNAQTFAMYGSLSILGFFMTIFLQQVAGYSALKAGATGLVPTIVMFALSARFGHLADRHGPRLFMTVGPLVMSAGFALLLRFGTSVSLLTDVLPALLVFSLGLAMTVAPLTATVLADADDNNAGIASA
ncbi:MAG: MFS transporter, partial [Thermoleophilia bacterium]|nr:MFS transporter [Thermoleophilia bacterium]